MDAVFGLLGCLVPVAFIILVVILSGIKLLYQYERGVVFTLGKFTKVLEPGFNIVIPIFQSMQKVDMRIMTGDIPSQEVMTKDNIPVLVNAVVYYKVQKPADAVIEIESYNYAVRQYTQAALRDVLGNAELDTILQEREQIAKDVQAIVDQGTTDWGVKIKAIKIQQIELPAEMKRVMAKQAEAEREKRASIITAEAELQASQNLSKAATILSANPVALQLRTLQTIRDIASDPSEKIILFMPSGSNELVGQIANVVSQGK